MQLISLFKIKRKGVLNTTKFILQYLFHVESYADTLITLHAIAQAVKVFPYIKDFIFKKNDKSFLFTCFP